MNEQLLYKTSDMEVRIIDGIATFELCPKEAVSLEIAREYKKVIEFIYEYVGRPFPRVTYVNQAIKVDQEAQDFLRSFAKKEFYSAHVYITSSLKLKAMLTYLLYLIPCQRELTKVFTDESKAREWLTKRMMDSDAVTIDMKAVENLKLAFG